MHIFVYLLFPGQGTALFWHYVLEQADFVSSSSWLCPEISLMLRRLPSISMFPYGFYLLFWGIQCCIFLCPGGLMSLKMPQLGLSFSTAVLEAKEEGGEELQNIFSMFMPEDGLSACSAHVESSLYFQSSTGWEMIGWGVSLQQILLLTFLKSSNNYFDSVHL